MSTGYIPKILTHRATAAAYKCDLALIIVCKNDLNIINGVLFVVVTGGDVVVVSFAAPPRGNNVALAIAVLVIRDCRFIGGYGRHIFVADDNTINRRRMESIEIALRL